MLLQAWPQTAHLNAFGAQIAASRCSPRTSPPRRRPAAGSAARAVALGAIGREVDLLEAAALSAAPERAPAAAGGDLHRPATSSGSSPASATCCRPSRPRSRPRTRPRRRPARARRPAGARDARGAPRGRGGPRFPASHWLVLQTLASCSCVGVALVTALHATTGARHPAAGILVGMTACALCLAGVVVSDVADLQAGMYTTDTNLAPALARLRPLLASLTAAKS